ncbi:extracellular solute-binding protein family 3 [Methylocella silvestris BL2]|uniref:Extracellular solute-binding protein family 3 n=1 Tax=Methylocella silvestris (strain DSM 15510 / CIP 108128 / LMG 27833 / NCIMB 13906 / BL2) TaxID=395965 RepID=B8EI52_METSB|nr:substrate-binding domain-containing protein [Methylocella silvestris]ACK50534.1 extracellular solute-binding protein family 3 [Methylocella silvestris BL2]
MTSRSRAFLLLVALSSAAAFGLEVRAEGADDAAIELVDPDVLRVCADPRDLPFSNEAGEGFENKIADLLAQKLGKSVAYVYYPNTTGFIRNTLNAHRCDVVMGIPQGDDIVQVTNPYYRASYAVVTKKGSDLESVESLSDPRLKGKHIGIVAGTPPATIIALNGLLPNIKSYALVVDTRADAPPVEMIKDLEAGDIDIAVLWGPIAGNFAKNAKTPLVATPLLLEKIGPRMVYRMGMGVRHSDQEWKRTLNKFIAENQTEIDAILTNYGVPLLDENDKPKTH